MHGKGNYKTPPPSEGDDEFPGRSTAPPTSVFDKSREHICTIKGMKGYLRKHKTYDPDQCAPKNVMDGIFALRSRSNVIFCKRPPGTSIKGSVLSIPRRRVDDKAHNGGFVTQYTLLEKGDGTTKTDDGTIKTDDGMAKAPRSRKQTGRTFLEITNVDEADSLVPRGHEKSIVAEKDLGLFFLEGSMAFRGVRMECFRNPEGYVSSSASDEPDGQL
jgi:hypothetical protein